MSADHKRPLYAFVIVAVLCALIIGNELRSQAVVGFIKVEVMDRISGQELHRQPAGRAGHREQPFTRADADRAVEQAPPGLPETSAGAAAPRSTAGSTAKRAHRSGHEGRLSFVHLVDQVHVAVRPHPGRAPGHSDGLRGAPGHHSAARPPGHDAAHGPDAVTHPTGPDSAVRHEVRGLAHGLRGHLGQLTSPVRGHDDHGPRTPPGHARDHGHGHDRDRDDRSRGPGHH